MYELKDKNGRSHGKNYLTTAGAIAVAVGMKLEDYTIAFSWGKPDEWAKTDDERASGRDLPPVGK